MLLVQLSVILLDETLCQVLLVRYYAMIRNLGAVTSTDKRIEDVKKLNTALRYN